MPPKGKKTKAEEALDFLSNLDNLDAEPGTTTAESAAPATGPTPRASTDSTRSKSKIPGVVVEDASAAGKTRSDTPVSASGGAGAVNEADEEAQKALDFLEAQIKTKRAPLSAPKPSTSRPTTPAPASATGSASTGSATAAEPTNVPTSAGSGWGSFWSTATSAIQSAQKIGTEGYQRVRTEGVSGVTGTLGHLNLEEQLKGRGVDLDALRKGAGERLGGLQGYVKGVDLDKLREYSYTPLFDVLVWLSKSKANSAGQDLLNTTSSTLSNIINTVAPPISAHETLELWLAHPLVGYAGVEGVVYRAFTTILDQTESGELVIVWSPESEGQDAGGRAINPIDGFEAGWKRQVEQVDSVKAREEKNPKGRTEPNANVPVTTVPIFLHIQPVLAPLPIPEPAVLLSSETKDAAEKKEKEAKQHLYFIFTLQDTVHSLQFSTVSQPSPADWLEVEYDRSDWVEERLVDVLRVGVEILAQDYVATRMALKPSAVTRPASPDSSTPAAPSAAAEQTPEAPAAPVPAGKADKSAKKD